MSNPTPKGRVSSVEGGGARERGVAPRHSTLDTRLLNCGLTLSKPATVVTIQPARGTVARTVCRAPSEERSLRIISTRSAVHCPKNFSAMALACPPRLSASGRPMLLMRPSVTCPLNRSSPLLGGETGGGRLDGALQSGQGLLRIPHPQPHHARRAQLRKAPNPLRPQPQGGEPAGKHREPLRPIPRHAWLPRCQETSASDETAHAGSTSPWPAAGSAAILPAPSRPPPSPPPAPSAPQIADTLLFPSYKDAPAFGERGAPGRRARSVTAPWPRSHAPRSYALTLHAPPQAFSSRN